MIYCLYADLFGGGESGHFDDATARLAHLEALGVDCVWLLPILDSPLRDGGFDVRQYCAVRGTLGGNAAFERFLAEAHRRGIRVLFDVAINHW